MPRTRLQITPPNRNLDASTPSTNAYLVQDGYLDSAGAFHRRPGLALQQDLSITFPELAGVGGLGQYWWQAKSMNIVVFGSRVFKITDTLGQASSVTELTGASLTGGRIVTFAECWDESTLQTLLFMANGSKLIYTDGTALYTLSGSNLPDRTSHVISLDTYIIVNDLDNPTQWRYCDSPKYPKNWTATINRYTPKNINDNIELIDNYRGYVLLQGTQNTEFWQDTGDTSPFSPLIGAMSHFGCINPYSYAKLDNDAVFFASSRDIVALNGYQPQIISQTYAKELQSLGVVADAQAEFINSIGGRKYYMVSFPDSGRTIVWNSETQSFSEWGSYNGTEYNIFNGLAYTYANDWGYHLLLDRSNPYVYKMSPDYYKDNTTTMKTQLITGWYDHGVSERKRTNNLRINVKRGMKTIRRNPYTLTVSLMSFDSYDEIPITGCAPFLPPFAMNAYFYLGQDYTFDPIKYYNLNTTEPSYNGLCTLVSWTPTSFIAFNILTGYVMYVSNATGTVQVPTSDVIITTTTNHNLEDGDMITITGTGSYDGDYYPTILSDTSFSIPVKYFSDESSVANIVVTPKESSPKLYLAYRDDNNTAWSDDIELDLGTEGNSLIPIELRGMGGIYTTRQYRFTFGDDADLSINSIEEDVELMR